MATILREEVRKLPDLEKLALVDEILTELDRPDPDIDVAWAAEVRERRSAYQTGRMESRSYADVMKRYSRA
ncbi:MAG: addiction module protein [Verrucomicrobia bacterium]|nr:addiction module protein [Verrucomicrobiota bacterium]